MDIRLIVGLIPNDEMSFWEVYVCTDMFASVVKLTQDASASSNPYAIMLNHSLRDAGEIMFA
jgi:hypothetical protein